MGRAGPATRQIATQSSSVLPLKPDFDFAPDRLAVTGNLSPIFRPSSVAETPVTLVDINFCDLTLGENTSYLPPR
ncbi:Hypothetical protein PHPALM_11522 [Phytophthora palmivora]|uniref:Uncharacterized protein n=1 Tax=Phytophthora palmivora TaxID=4796 RepID=A0A2P4Y2B3_9STRA|nr:Hypothetical protein PHPALM_11522 [Phytophthora palmivora]